MGGEGKREMQEKEGKADKYHKMTTHRIFQNVKKGHFLL